MAVLPNFNFSGGGVQRLPYSYMQQDVLGQRLQDLPQQAQLAGRYVTEAQRYAPVNQSEVMARGAAGTLMGGRSLEEQIADRIAMRQRVNSVLGNIAGSGASGADFTQRARAEALPEIANAEAQYLAREQEARREGAGRVFGGLSSVLTGPDSAGEAYGKLLASMQQGYGYNYRPIIRRGFGGY